MSLELSKGATLMRPEDLPQSTSTTPSPLASEPEVGAPQPSAPEKETHPKPPSDDVGSERSFTEKLQDEPKSVDRGLPPGAPPETKLEREPGFGEDIAAMPAAPTSMPKPKRPSSKSTNKVKAGNLDNGAAQKLAATAAQAPAAPTEANDSPESAPVAAQKFDGAGVGGAANKDAGRAPKAGTDPAQKRSKKTSNKKEQPRPRKVVDVEPKPEEVTDDQPGSSPDAAALEAERNLRCLHVEGIGAPRLPPGFLTPAVAMLFPDPAAAAPVAALLAAVAAAAGSAIGFATGKDNNEECGGVLSLRVVVVGDEVPLASAIGPVLQAAYALQAEETKSWIVDEQTEALLTAVAKARQRLYLQTAANAALLNLNGSAGLVGPPEVRVSPKAPPTFVLRDAAPTVVKTALAAATKGTLVVDSRKMPTHAGWGTNYDIDGAVLLNNASAGNLLELADPRAHGAVRMRTACVSVIGRVTDIGTFSLYKAEPAALASTLLVPAAAAPTVVAGAAIGLTRILTRARALEPDGDGKPRRLRLTAAARKALEQAKRKWSRSATSMLPPLSDYYGGAADLAHRIATVLHVLDHVSDDTNALREEVDGDVVRRAVEFVEQYALPAATSVLAKSSIAPVLRDARRILAFAQRELSPDEAVLSRRDLVRHWPHSMTQMEIRHALHQLVSDGLLAPQTEGGAHAFTVAAVVFDPANRLPDLATDPRRPRQ